MRLTRSESGVSLIQVMILATILGGLSIAAMTMSKNMNKERKTAEKKLDIDKVMNEIEVALSNKDTCSVTVFGAHATNDTRLSGIKELDTSGSVVAHSRLVVSTPTSPLFLAPGLIINGMFLKYVPENPPLVPVINGRHFDLHITFMKNTRATTSAVSADTFYGSNLVTKKIRLRLDTCNRWVASGNNYYDASIQCSNHNGSSQIIGKAIPITWDVSTAQNDAGVFDTMVFAACQDCSSKVQTVKGCL